MRKVILLMLLMMCSLVSLSQEAFSCDFNNDTRNTIKIKILLKGYTYEEDAKTNSIFTYPLNEVDGDMIAFAFSPNDNLISSYVVYTDILHNTIEGYNYLVEGLKYLDKEKKYYTERSYYFKMNKNNITTKIYIDKDKSLIIDMRKNF